MYQAGNNTILQSSNTSGGVYLQGALVQVGSETGEAGVKYVKDNQIELYFNNNKKLETTNTGAIVTGILTATAFIPTSQGALSHRNIVVNGAMNVAQRGTSSTEEGYKTVDRFQSGGSGEDEIPTQAQHSLSTSDTPYALGFRKSFHLTNGNQTGGAGSSDYVQPEYRFEGQDLANCGWNYTSSSSFITLSFWVKSSVAGDYTLNFGNNDGTQYRYLMEYSLLADTWKHVVFKIPGNSNLTFDDDNGHGATIMWYPYLGSGYVQADQENNWYASSNGKYGTTSTTSWWTTNDATWEITGVQLEVGPVATPFEHRSYGEELLRCKRYYQRSTDSSRGTNYTLASSSWHSADGVQSFSKHNNYYDFKERFEVEMRVAPTLTIYGSTNQGDIHIERVAVGSQQVDWNNNTTEVKTKGFLLRHIEDSYGTSGSGNGFGILAYTVDAEL